MIFLLQQLTSMNFFRPVHEYFLGLLVIHYSFTFNLSFAWTLFVLHAGLVSALKRNNQRPQIWRL